MPPERLGDLFLKLFGPSRGVDLDLPRRTPRRPGASLVATAAAYGYRIRVEDEMLVAAFGDSYARYRRDVGALLPSRPAPSS